MAKIISIAKDFSRYPAGREEEDGPFNGEKFRDEHLKPALDKYNSVLIKLDGTRGYGSSFLEEAFGGIVRKGYDKSTLEKKLSFESKDQSLIEEIKEYISDADL